MDINEITETLEDLIIQAQRLEKKIASLIAGQTSIETETKALENRIATLEASQA